MKQTLILRPSGPEEALKRHLLGEGHQERHVLGADHLELCAKWNVQVSLLVDPLPFHSTIILDTFYQTFCFPLFFLERQSYSYASRLEYEPVNVTGTSTRAGSFTNSSAPLQGSGVGHSWNPPKPGSNPLTLLSNRGPPAPLSDLGPSTPPGTSYPVSSAPTSEGVDPIQPAGGSATEMRKPFLAVYVVFSMPLPASLLKAMIGHINTLLKVSERDLNIAQKKNGVI